jgi:hypothetical protein
MDNYKFIFAKNVFCVVVSAGLFAAHQPTFGLESGAAAGAGSGNGLLEHGVGNVAGSKYAVNVCGL